MITYFKDQNHKSKKRYKKDKMLTTILKSFDTIVIFGATSSSTTLSLTGIGLIAIPNSSGVACGLTIGNKIIYEIVMKNYDIYIKNNIKKIYKQLILLINYIENVYKIIFLIE